MAYNLLIGGAAGQGIDTTAAILEKLLKRSGYYVFTLRDFMSRIRGGHNFTQIRFGDRPLASHADQLDGIVALDGETITRHIGQLKPDGFILCDDLVATEDPRVLRLSMAAIAKRLGNPRVAGNIAAGALMRLFGEPLDADAVASVLRDFVKADFLEINRTAFAEGYAAVAPRFERRPGDAAGHMILTGSKAMGLGALAAGMRFYSAYPMSPSTAVMEYLASKSLEAGVVVEQAEDEISAINMVIGASYAGVRAMTSTSGGGFSLMVEALGLAGITEIPLVVADVQRPGPATGLPTRTEQSDLSFVLTAAQGEFPRMVIAVRHHADVYRQTIRAFELAERYQLPVILLSDQYLADASATVPPFEVPEIRLPAEAMADILASVEAETGDGEYLRYRITESGVSPRLLPGKSRHLVIIDSDEHEELGIITESADVRRAMVDKRMRKLDCLTAELEEPDWIGPEGATEAPPDVLLLGWGSLWGPLTEAVGLLNSDAGPRFGALVFGDLSPLPTRRLAALAAGAGRIVNVEQNATGQLARLIREQTGIACAASILKYDGRQLSGEEIADRIRKEALS